MGAMGTEHMRGDWCLYRGTVFCLISWPVAMDLSNILNLP